MKGNEKIFEELGNIDEKYVAEAAEAPKKKKHPKISYIAVSIAAAALVAVGLGGKYFILDRYNFGCFPEYAENTGFVYQYDLPENSGEPEKISTHIMPGVGGMGFEGLLTYDVNELLNNNPWLEGIALTELPVFTYKEKTEKLSADEMEEKLRRYAAILGKEVINVERIDGTNIPQAKIDAIKEKLEAVGEEFHIEDYYGPSEVKVDAGSVKFDMKDNGEIIISRNIADFKEWNIPYPDKEYDDAVQILNNMSGEFFHVIQYQYPKPSVFRDYSFEGEAHTQYALYDRSPDPLTRLLNYNFRRTSYWLDGNTVMLRINNEADMLDCVAMYPIITEEQAFEKLMNGEYLTTVWEEEYLPDGMSADRVTFAGVFYRRTEDYKYMMPYYRYLVELDTEGMDIPEGAKEYGGYYVPAVKEEYIENVETEVAFN